MVTWLYTIIAKTLCTLIIAVVINGEAYHPCNLHNEHINKLYKDIIANMGVNFTESASTYAARAVPSLERLVGFGRLASIQKQLLTAGDQM